jgi:hypothetical protein
MAQGAICCSLCGNLNVAMGQNSGWQEKQIAFRSVGSRITETYHNGFQDKYQTYKQMKLVSIYR